MIKINLYDYRRVALEVGIQKQVVTAMGIVALALILSGVAYLMDMQRVSDMSDQARAVEGQVKALEPQFAQVQDLKGQEGNLTGRITSIDGLRGQIIPVTTLLEDISDNLPQGLWLEGISKAGEDEVKGKIPLFFMESNEPPPAPKPGQEAPAPHQFIKIDGKAKTQRAITNFMERMENMDYLDHVGLSDSKYSFVNFQPVRKFTVYAHVTGSGPQPE